MQRLKKQKGGLFEFFLTVALYQPWALFKTSKGWVIGFAWQVTILTLPVNPAEKSLISCEKKHQRGESEGQWSDPKEARSKKLRCCPRQQFSAGLSPDGAGKPRPHHSSVLIPGSWVQRDGSCREWARAWPDCLNPIGKKRSPALDSLLLVFS